MDVILTKVAETLVLPPGINVAGVLLGLWLLRRWRRTAMTVIFAAALGLYVMSLPWLARVLVASLETYPALSVEQAGLSGAGVIAVLGGGIYPQAPEYGRDSLASGSLPRVRYAAHLQRATGLPILVTGGRVFGEGVSEGELMRDFLEQELSAEVAYVEDRSLNTAENARYSKRILEAAGIARVIVVTNAWHMARAAGAFEREGLAVTPAPIEFRSPLLERPGLLAWMPNPGALGTTTLALREYLGRLWYALRY